MAEEPRKPVGVIVVDFNLPFRRLVFFLLKCALAAIPALMLLGLLWYAVSSFMAGAGTVTVAPAVTQPPGRTADATFPTRDYGLEPNLGVMTRQIRIDSKRDATFRACSKLPASGAAEICARHAGDCIRAVSNAAVTESETDALLGCLDSAGQ